MTIMSWISRAERRKLNVCRYCSGDERHSCTSFSCIPAVNAAEQEYRRDRKTYMEKEFKGSGDGEHYGVTIMEALHEVLEIGMEEDINSIRRMYGLDEILDAVLVYEGLLGYSEKLLHIIEEIFKVDLLELDV